MTKSQLETLLRKQMPLAKAMEVQVQQVDDTHMELTCALNKNYNHIGSAFGGSLSALMILAAYCRLFHIMGGEGHVVVKKNAAEFFKPVHEDLKAVCLTPSSPDVEQFMKLYTNKGRGRLTLVSEIRLKDGTVAARMESEFVGFVSQD